MGRNPIRAIVVLTTIALALPPPNAFAKSTPIVHLEATNFSTAQLDAMLASIALYPDELLTLTLMASTYPLQVVTAARWLAKDDNKSLRGDALLTALEKENWDPSVKSLVPFPQVIATMNDHLEWTQQLGYAVANQQAAVLNSIQRLRRQAEKAGGLKTTEQQRVVVREETIIIEPASAETVYVPVYQPANVYGEWPYEDFPPVYFPPAEAYYPAVYAPGYVWGAGLAFAAGVAAVGALRGWARPNWGYGNVSVNPLRYNTINVNRAQISSGTWRAGSAVAGGRPTRPPGGPVGAPGRGARLPTNAIGRSNVQVPGSTVNRPQIAAGAGGLGQNRASGAQRAGGPGAGQLRAGGQRANVVRRSSPRPTQRRAAALGGIGYGTRAGQYGARGAQSRGFHQSAIARSGGYGGGHQARSGSFGGGYQARGGGGGFRGGGGGFRGSRR